MEPLVGSTMRMSALPVVDLPQPDSPTSPSVSPSKMSKLTPATALSVRRWLVKVTVKVADPKERRVVAHAARPLGHRQRVPAREGVARFVRGFELGSLLSALVVA